MFGSGARSTDGQRQRESRSTATSVTLFLGLEQPSGLGVHGATATYQIDLIKSEKNGGWNLFVGGSGLSSSSRLKVAETDLIGALTDITACAVVHILGNAYMLPYFRLGDMFAPDAALEARVKETFSRLADADLERNLKRYLILSGRKLSLSSPDLSTEDQLVVNVELARRNLDITNGRHDSLVALDLELWRTLDFRKAAEIVETLVNHPPKAVPDLQPAVEHLLFKMYGSTSIGDELAPALAREFLKTHIGATETGCYEARQPYKGSMAAMQHCWGKVPGTSQLQVIEIYSAGSEKAFECLSEKTCDLGLASRPLTPGDRVRYPNLDDLTARGAEHIIGIDGTAIVMNEKAAALRSLSLPQVRRIFCETSDPIESWDELGVAGLGQIHRVVRNEGSGMREMFVEQVCGTGGRLRKVPLQDQLKSEELVKFVISTPAAMGFVSSTMAGRAVAIPLAPTDGQRPVRPDSFSIATEDYPLTWRLYVYNTSTVPQIGDKFIRFVVSRQGQEVVKENRFAPLLPQRLADASRFSTTPVFRRWTANACRLSLSFRFESGSAELTPDRLTHDNIERLKTYIEQNPGVQLLVFGFADSLPMPGRRSNQRLSELRAEAIARELQRQLGISYSGLVVKGFGTEMPVDSNETPRGQYRNRRVEIWVKP
jgi:phosphate transport system substrate-binding protein